MPIKSKYIKDIGAKIWDTYPELVSDDYESNKTLVDTVTNVESKKVRNRVAGYLSRLHAIDKQEPTESTKQE